MSDSQEYDPVVGEIIRAVYEYENRIIQGNPGYDVLSQEHKDSFVGMLRGAYLSGASQTAAFITATDGDPSTTPSKISEAISKTARIFGL